ncbi:MAG TPA: hypothetical protein VFE22_08485, partial [Edaphobacter sp.]|nr:hypothetical protein [Edaphobacter sp.]
EAIDQAQQELGPDALLLNSREAPPEARHLGAFEVVFAGQLDEIAFPCPSAATPAKAPDDLRQSVDEIRQMIGKIAASTRGMRAPYGPVELTLLDAGVGDELARDIDEAVQRRAGRRVVPNISRSHQTVPLDPEMLTAELSAEILSRFEVSPEIGSITALVGPAGSGKTTTLIKLAVTQGLALGKPVRLISADTERIGAREQLRNFAAILGAPFQAVESVAALARAIDNCPSNSLILIDTPGYSRASLQESGQELSAFFSHRQEIDVHLALTASMRSSDLANAADRFAIFHPSKLLFTQVDETTSLAPAFCEAVRQQKPLSFFCAGQSIPEDIEPASKDRIVSSLVSQLPQALRAVA